MNYHLLKETYPHINLEFNHPLADYSFTKTGGNADVIAFPKTREEVQQIVRWTQAHDVPLTILGRLSNLIVRDGGIRGVVMILTQMNRIIVDGNRIYADSGASLIDVSRTALDHGLTGLEFACGIPGSIGGAIFMNAGAYGGEVKDIPLTVTTVNMAGDVLEYTNATSDFGYRHSVYQEIPDIIVGTTFELQPGEPEAIREQMDHLTDLRQSKQPLEYPSCGSVFKRPEGYFTGKLIQDAGLQGYRIGGAEVSRKHAGFIVNIGGATATDYLQVIAHIQETIWNLNQVQLETEVRIIGEHRAENSDMHES